MKKILVIESDPIYQAEICRLLRLEKYEVIRAKTGKDGLNFALQKHPNLILCDVNISDLTGYEVLEKLRFNDSASRIPVVFLASKTDVDSYSHAMKLGASAYLSKMASPSQLLRVVATQLR